jgi:hypothetical protein
VTRLATWTAGNSGDRAAIAFLLDALDRRTAGVAAGGRRSRTAAAHGPLEPATGRVAIPHRPEDAADVGEDLVHRLEVDSGPEAVLPVDVVSVIGALLRDEADGAIGRTAATSTAVSATRAARRPDTPPARSWTILERSGWWLQRRLGIVGDRWPDGARFAVGCRTTWTIRTATRPSGRSRTGRSGSAWPRTLAVRATETSPRGCASPVRASSGCSTGSWRARRAAGSRRPGSSPRHPSTNVGGLPTTSPTTSRTRASGGSSSSWQKLATRSACTPGTTRTPRPDASPRSATDWSGPRALPSTATGITTGTSAWTRRPPCSPTMPPDSDTTARSPSTTTSAPSVDEPR